MSAYLMFLVSDPSSTVVPRLNVAPSVAEGIQRCFHRVAARDGYEAAKVAVAEGLRTADGVSVDFSEVRRSSMNPHDMVVEFHTLYDQPVLSEPRLPAAVRSEMRLKLCREEVDELEEAFAMPQETEDERRAKLAAIADALGDLLYVTYGAAIEHGIPLDVVVEEIHRSNLSKLGEDGKPIYRSDGKVLKGPNFTEPNLQLVLFPEE